MNLVLYGPPGVGKTTVGRLVAQQMGREFVDGDAWIEARWARPVEAYFDNGEVALFRAREGEAYRALAARDDLVIAPGGGALLSPHTRARLEGTGVLICLTARLEILLTRLQHGPIRPLLRECAPDGLGALLKERAGLYGSFALQINTDARTVVSVAEEAIARFHAVRHFARFELSGGSALMGRSLLSSLPEFLAHKGLALPFVVVSDSHVAPLHGAAVAQMLAAPLIQFPAGEGYKTLETVRGLYAPCVRHGLDRGGTLVAVGGGVVGDVAGFVAATLMRGVRWVNLPTTVLAMADASLGGKVGVDLPEGKNLVGAFHPPSLVVADFDALATLPDIEVRCGLAEIVKAAIIGDSDLFSRLGRRGERHARVPDHTHAPAHLHTHTLIARAAAVKVGIVNADPAERGERAQLNFGHTVGHGIEGASGYAWRHGEAVAVGMVAEAQLAEAMGLAESGLAGRLADCLTRLGLPTRAAGLKPADIRVAMDSDKKKRDGKLKFALPKRIGGVVWGIEADEDALADVLEKMTDDN